jgi:hypothetical protein
MGKARAPGTLPVKWVTAPLSAKSSVSGRTSQRVAKGEWQREAKRVLPRLTRQGNRLFPVPGEGTFAIATSAVKACHARRKVTDAIVAALAAQGLIAAAGEAYDLTEPGRAWLTRDKASTDQFRAQHRLDGTRMVDGRGHGTRTGLTPLRVNLAETPLGWLRKRKGADGRPLITQAQFDAGEKLRADFTIAQMTPRLTANLEVQHGGRAGGGRSPGGGLEMTERAVAARQRFYKALDAVGAGLSDPLVDVCCYLHGLEDAERRMGWPQRSGKVVLAIALDRLAAHYGFTAHPQPPIRSRRHVWHAGTAGQAEEEGYVEPDSGA